jgi:hypothetical protein
MLLKKKRILGQSLIDILISLGIFSILSVAIFSSIGLALNFVAFNRSRVTARHIAQEKIEFLRNLPYDQIGTIGGIPSGDLPQEEKQVKNKLNFKIKTTIVYIDDNFDDTAPIDTLPTDYKRVRIEVTWEGTAGSNKSPIVLLTDISPKGIETTSGGGTLSVLVFDAHGNPVSQANVAIQAPTLSPPIDLTLMSGTNGRVILPGAPVCISCYKITVTKENYSTEQTYSTAVVANPNKPDQTIIEGKLTEISFAIDQLSTMKLVSKNTVEDGFAIIPNIRFKIRGNKTIGTDTNSQPIYKYSKTLSTDSSGNLTIPDLEWDGYSITRDNTLQLDIAAINPLQPVIINPATTLNVEISFANHTANNLLVTFIDSSSVPIASVSANLSQGLYNKTILSGTTDLPNYGQVFYSGLSTATYLLTASAAGYLNYNANIQISGQSLEQIVLSQ